MTSKIDAEALNWPAVKPTRAAIMTMALNPPENLSYLLLKYSGTVLTEEDRNFGARGIRIMNAIPMAMMYHEALMPQEPYALATTPSELPPPISVAARVPAINSGPNRLPATMKSVLVLIFLEE